MVRYACKVTQDSLDVNILLENLGAGMVVMAIPIFTSKENSNANVGDNVASRTEYYTTAKNLLVAGADAMERLMTAYKVVSYHVHTYMRYREGFAVNPL